MSPTSIEDDRNKFKPIFQASVHTAQYVLESCWRCDQLSLITVNMFSWSPAHMSTCQPLQPSGFVVRWGACSKSLEPKRCCSSSKKPPERDGPETIGQGRPLPWAWPPVSVGWTNPKHPKPSPRLVHEESPMGFVLNQITRGNDDQLT